MPFHCIIKVANPSDYDRSDYVEVDLQSLGVPADLDERSLRLFRLWPGTTPEEIAGQIDYPFGRHAGHRVLCFYCAGTPKVANNYNYTHPSAEFSLEEGTPRDFTTSVRSDLLKIEHYTQPGKYDQTWNPADQIVGVKLFNGGDKLDVNKDVVNGLQVYFSLKPRPEVASPVNYAGAATSIVHHRAWRTTSGGGEVLAAPYWWWKPAPEKRWGQLTRIDLYPLPWEPRFYQIVSLIGKPGEEPAYTLAWSKCGPHRAVVSLKSEPIIVRYSGKPFFRPDEKTLTCHLFRMICLYPNKEFYTEQLFMHVEGEEVASLSERISLAFRAHYYSYVDYPPSICPEPARLAEDIPDYFAIWRHFATEYRGYAFASDSHVRTFKVNGPEISWRLQVGHEHRCVHLFPFSTWPQPGVDRLSEVGHTAWYEWLFKPLQSIPLTRYLRD